MVQEHGVDGIEDAPYQGDGQANEVDIGSGAPGQDVEGQDTKDQAEDFFPGHGFVEEEKIQEGDDNGIEGKDKGHNRGVGEAEAGKVANGKGRIKKPPNGSQEKALLFTYPEGFPGQDQVDQEGQAGKVKAEGQGGQDAIAGLVNSLGQDPHGPKA